MSSIPTQAAVSAKLMRCGAFMPHARARDKIANASQTESNDSGTLNSAAAASAFLTFG